MKFGINFPCFSFNFLKETRAMISNLANMPSFQDFTVDLNAGVEGGGGQPKKKKSNIMRAFLCR